MDKIEKAQQLLTQLRAQFLDELAERCDRIEEGVLALQDAGDEAAFDHLYREIHSLKGSAGTHGLPAITTVCHRFEDALSAEDTGQQDHAAQCDVYLRFVDLLRQCNEIALSQTSDFEPIDQALETIRQQLRPQSLSGLVVENSRAMRALYQGALADCPVQLNIMDDGLEALDRLLTERFDFVVMGAETRRLNGTALLYALRQAHGPNRHAPALMISTSKAGNFCPGMVPDYLIQRDAQLIQKLHAALHEIAAGQGGPDE